MGKADIYVCEESESWQTAVRSVFFFGFLNREWKGAE